MAIDGFRGFAGVFLTSLTMLGMVVGQQDPIDSARARQSIADQKAEADVVAAVRNAETLAKTNPAKAGQILRSIQTNIGQSAAISPKTQQTLTLLLQLRLAALDGKDPKDAKKGEKANSTLTASDKKTLENYSIEVREVQEGVAAVARLQSARKTQEADQLTASLAAKYPNNPAVIALAQKESTGKNVADSQALGKMQNERLLLTQNTVLKSSIPPAGDIEFPSDWKEITKRRRGTEVELTAKEKSLIEALDKPVSLAFNDQPLDYALQQLSNLLDQNLVIDSKSINDQTVDLKKPTSANLKDVSARTALRQILGGAGLTFVVKDQTIQVVSVERAREMLVTRVYYLGDLVQGVGPFGGALTWGPLIDYQQTNANVKLIIDSIEASIDPLAWKDKGGGPCTINFHFPSMSLIVRASSEVHASLGTKLSRGR